MNSNRSCPQRLGRTTATVLAPVNPPIYRNIDAQDSDLLHTMRSLKFEYEIASSFERFHNNPPLWQDFHSHVFEVRLTFQSRQNPGDLYGLDMIEMQQKLKALISKIPPIVNNLPGCESGTTEALCSFFANIRTLIADSLIRLIKVSVSETSDRVTTLLLQD
jgi:6-pyruvoyl tetrahydropterin synthase